MFCLVDLYLIQSLKAFNGKKWEKFNSEKVASLAYARIQGKVALVSHFQNSSLMNEDKRCRPILFQFEGHESDDMVCLLVLILNGTFYRFLFTMHVIEIFKLLMLCRDW